MERYSWETGPERLPEAKNINAGLLFLSLFISPI